MKHYPVLFSASAAADLARIFAYVSQTSSSERAELFTRLIVADCRSLQTAPERGTLLKDGLRRMRVARKRATVFFIVSDTVRIVAIRAAGFSR